MLCFGGKSGQDVCVCVEPRPGGESTSLARSYICHMTRIHSFSSSSDDSRTQKNERGGHYLLPRTRDALSSSNFQVFKCRKGSTVFASLPLTGVFIVCGGTSRTNMTLYLQYCIHVGSISFVGYIQGDLSSPPS